MPSPAKNNAIWKDTNRVQNQAAQEGTPTAEELSRPPKTAAVKQTTVRISRAEQTPAIQTLVRRNLESSWHRYEDQCQEDIEGIAGKDLYGLSLLGYADSLADQFITTEIVSEASFLYAGGKRNWNTSEAQKKGMDRISESAKTASNWTKFAELTMSSIQADLGRADYLLQFPEAARAALNELIEDGALTSCFDSFFKGAGWTNTLLQQHFSSLREPIKRKLVDTIYKVCNLSCSMLKESKSAPTMEQLAHRLQTLETRVMVTESKTAAFTENFKDIISHIAESELAKYKADFAMEDLKLSLSHQDSSWYKLNKEERLNQVSQTLKAVIPETWQNCEVWISPNKAQQKHAFAKVTFNSRKEKGLFEKLLKEHRLRENEKGKQSFISRRMTPLSFSFKKKLLLDTATSKLAQEWCTMVKDLGKESKWISNEQQAGKCMGTRIQYITDPQLKVWVEALDPVHRHVWREVIFSSEVNFFENYNLDEEIPCPHTRLLSENNPGMKTRRVDKYKGDILLTTEERSRNKRVSRGSLKETEEPGTPPLNVIPSAAASSPPKQPTTQEPSLPQPCPSDSEQNGGKVTPATTNKEVVEVQE